MRSNTVDGRWLSEDGFSCAFVMIRLFNAKAGQKAKVFVEIINNLTQPLFT